MRFLNSFFILLLFVVFTHAQNTPTKAPSNYEDYDEYFKMSRVSLYLHLNKSSFLSGENLWFQGYAYNRQTQKLAPKVRNVELGVYDDKGNMIDKKLYLAIDGLFKGQIAIDSTYKNGEYYLKAETNWMKNFNEDYTHVQKFEVLGESSTKTKQTLESYDFQILPESGHIVENCDGVLGLKLINQKGLGVKFEATLLENEKPILNFKSNQFGLAKVDLKPKSGHQYQIKANLPNGKTILKTIEDIKSNGYTIKVNNILKAQTIIYVSSNLSSTSQYENNDVKLLIHQEGKRFEVPVQLSKQKPQVAKVIKKEQLFYGVNTITLFVNDKPVAERLIFNRKNSLNNEEDLDVTVSSSNKTDTLNLNLVLPKYNNKANVSISILPENTISYTKNQSIASELLLAPFLNGYIENKPYYFKNPNRVVDYNLDLLLLTQGWSRYNWNNIFNKSPKTLYERKDGLVQNININREIPENINKLLIYSTLFNDDLVIPLNGKKSFTIQNRYPLVGEKMEFSLIDNKQNFTTPKAVVGTQLRLDKDKIQDDQFLPSLSNLRQSKLALDNNRLYANFLKGELLDEVIVKAKKEEKEENQNYASNFKNNTLKVDEEIAATFPLLSDYLSYRGYLVQDNGGGFSIRNLARTSIQGSNTPVVYFNGVQLNDLSILGGSRTSDYEEIYIDKTGYGGGVQGANGIIRLQQRRTALFTNKNSSKTKLPYSQFEVKQGFEPPKSFYMPEYAFFKTESFQQVGTIGWFTDVVIEPNKSNLIEIFDTQLYKFKLFIEGIGEDGSIINIEKTVSR